MAPVATMSSREPGSVGLAHELLRDALGMLGGTCMALPVVASMGSLLAGCGLSAISSDTHWAWVVAVLLLQTGEGGGICRQQACPEGEDAHSRCGSHTPASREAMQRHGSPWAGGLQRGRAHHPGSSAGTLRSELWLYLIFPSFQGDQRITWTQPPQGVPLGLHARPWVEGTFLPTTAGLPPGWGQQRTEPESSSGPTFSSANGQGPC